MKTVLIILFAGHGLVHVVGFARAFGLLKDSGSNEGISKWGGLLWLMTALLFFAAAISFGRDNALWWFPAWIALILSQALIVANWKDARFGSFVNLVILIPLVLGFFAWKFEGEYHADVRNSLKASSGADLHSGSMPTLPDPVRRYLKYTGAAGRPVPQYMRITFSGKMRGKDQDWFPFHSEQYNFFHPARRHFFMQGRVRGLQTSGYHRYTESEAEMNIRVLSVYPVIEAAGKEMHRAETVTWFNDLCIYAPGYLADTSIHWSTIDSLTVKAHYTGSGETIDAILQFNPAGQLVNFISDDRLEWSDGQYRSFRWSTPVSDYREVNGMKLPSQANAVWHYPEGEYVYGTFNLVDIQYDPQLP